MGNGLRLLERHRARHDGRGAGAGTADWAPRLWGMGRPQDVHGEDIRRLFRRNEVGNGRQGARTEIRHERHAASERLDRHGHVAHEQGDRPPGGIRRGEPGRDHTLVQPSVLPSVVRLRNDGRGRRVQVVERRVPISRLRAFLLPRGPDSHARLHGSAAGARARTRAARPARGGREAVEVAGRPQKSPCALFPGVGARRAD